MPAVGFRFLVFTRANCAAPSQEFAGLIGNVGFGAEALDLALLPIGHRIMVGIEGHDMLLVARLMSLP
jgi:hypothetical protein